MDPSTLDEIRAVARRLLSGTTVLAAYVYGSRVGGSPKSGSDLDIGYYLRGYRFGEVLSLATEMTLADRFSEAVELPVDLRNLAEAPLELRGRVLEEGSRIYSANEPERVGLERDLLSRYHDYKESFRRFHELRLKGIATRGL